MQPEKQPPCAKLAHEHTYCTRLTFPRVRHVEQVCCISAAHSEGRAGRSDLVPIHATRDLCSSVDRHLSACALVLLLLLSTQRRWLSHGPGTMLSGRQRIPGTQSTVPVKKRSCLGWPCSCHLVQSPLASAAVSCVSQFVQVAPSCGVTRGPTASAQTQSWPPGLTPETLPPDKA